LDESYKPNGDGGTGLAGEESIAAVVVERGGALCPHKGVGEKGVQGTKKLNRWSIKIGEVT